MKAIDKVMRKNIIPAVLMLLIPAFLYGEKLPACRTGFGTEETQIFLHDENHVSLTSVSDGQCRQIFRRDMSSDEKDGYRILFSKGFGVNCFLEFIRGEKKVRVIKKKAGSEPEFHEIELQEKFDGTFSEVTAFFENRIEIAYSYGNKIILEEFSLEDFSLCRHEMLFDYDSSCLYEYEDENGRNYVFLSGEEICLLCSSANSFTAVRQKNTWGKALAFYYEGFENLLYGAFSDGKHISVRPVSGRENAESLCPPFTAQKETVEGFFIYGKNVCLDFKDETSGLHVFECHSKDSFYRKECSQIIPVTDGKKLYVLVNEGKWSSLKIHEKGSITETFLSASVPVFNCHDSIVFHDENDGSLSVYAAASDMKRTGYRILSEHEKSLLPEKIAESLFHDSLKGCHVFFNGGILSLSDGLELSMEKASAFDFSEENNDSFLFCFWDGMNMNCREVRN